MNRTQSLKQDKLEININKSKKFFSVDTHSVHEMYAIVGYVVVDGGGGGAGVGSTRYQIYNYRNNFFYLLDSTTGNAINMIWFQRM